MKGDVTMKRLMHCSEPVFGMANHNPNKSGLSVIIWSEHNGISRKNNRNIPRVKIGGKDYSISISISDKPKILSKSKNIKKSEMDKLTEGIEYVARNADIFLKHFSDTEFQFDDEDLFAALRLRGEYK